nr:hypothetical protein Iba_chr14eCG8660 [Ipomoea batatas]
MHFHVDLHTLAKLPSEFRTKYSPKLNSIRNETRSPQQKGLLRDWYTRWGLVNLHRVASSKPIRTFAHYVQVRKLSPSLVPREKYRRSRSKGIQLTKLVEEGVDNDAFGPSDSSATVQKAVGVVQHNVGQDVEMTVGILKLQGVVVIEALEMEVKAEHSSTGRVEHPPHTHRSQHFINAFSDISLLRIEEDTEDGSHVGVALLLRLRQWYELQSRVILIIGKQRIDVRINVGIGGKRQFHDQHSDGELWPCLQEELRRSDCGNKCWSALGFLAYLHSRAQPAGFKPENIVNPDTILDPVVRQRLSRNPLVPDCALAIIPDISVLEEPKGKQEKDDGQCRRVFEYRYEFWLCDAVYRCEGSEVVVS